MPYWKEVLSIKIKQIRRLQRKFALFYYHSFVDTLLANPYSSGSKHCCVAKDLSETGIQGDRREEQGST